MTDLQASQPALSLRPVSSPRVVNVYSPRGWIGPRPAIVTSADTAGKISVAIFRDDADSIPFPSHLAGVRLYEPMTDEQRAAMPAVPGAPSCWAEWPTGDATRASGGVTADVGERLNKFGERIASMESAAEARRVALEEHNGKLSAAEELLGEQGRQIAEVRELLKELVARVERSGASANVAVRKREGNVDGEEAPDPAGP